MVLVIETQETLHAVLFIERPHELPIIVFKSAERSVDLPVESKEIAVTGISRIAG